MGLIIALISPVTPPHSGLGGPAGAGREVGCPQPLLIWSFPAPQPGFRTPPHTQAFTQLLSGQPNWPNLRNAKKLVH